MKAQIIDDEVVAWGIAVIPSDGIVLVDCPADYSPELYDYIDGNFIKKES